MAETFFSDITSSLLQTLASKACKEISRAHGVYDDLIKLKDTLSIVRGLLIDAEKKKDKPHRLTEWLRQIQNIYFDAEDRMKVCNFFSSSNSLVFRIRMAHQIQEIKDKLDKVAADGIKFGLMRIDVDNGQVVQRREMTHSYVDATTLIGRENDREEIIKLLMQPHPYDDGDSDKSLCVIPIVGMRGFGKTSLAKLVFNDKRMDELLQLKIWVCVSDDFDIKQLIIKIINFASAPIAALAHHENISHLDIERHTLEREFLLVLDDIWNEDRGKWIELEDLIKAVSKGSTILVTTRKSIALMMGIVPYYVLEDFSRKNCFSLFFK